MTTEEEIQTEANIRAAEEYYQALWDEEQTISSKVTVEDWMLEEE